MLATVVAEGNVLTGMCLSTGEGGYAWSQVPSGGGHVQGRGLGMSRGGMSGVGMAEGGYVKGVDIYNPPTFTNGTWVTHP